MNDRIDAGDWSDEKVCPAHDVPDHREMAAILSVEAKYSEPQRMLHFWVFESVDRHGHLDAEDDDPLSLPLLPPQEIPAAFRSKNIPDEYPGKPPIALVVGVEAPMGAEGQPVEQMEWVRLYVVVSIDTEPFWMLLRNDGTFKPRPDAPQIKPVITMAEELLSMFREAGENNA